MRIAENVIFPCYYNKSALLIVDLQNDFVRVGAPLEVPEARKNLPVVRRLIDVCRNRSIPIIYTKFIAGPKRTLIWTWSPQLSPDIKCCWKHHKRFYPDVGKELECSDIVDEIYPLPTDYIVEKYGYSAFHNTQLIDILVAEERDTIIVVGTVTQICVEHTVRDAVSYNIKAVVVSDGVSSFDLELHNNALRGLAMKYAMVISSSTLISLLEKDN